MAVNPSGEVKKKKKKRSIVIKRPGSTGPSAASFSYRDEVQEQMTAQQVCLLSMWT